MYVNRAQKSIVCKVCYWGPAGVGKGEKLQGLYAHFAATDGEHTQTMVRTFVPAEELLLEHSESEAAGLMASAEESLGAPYAELVKAGTLVWFRSRISEGEGQQFHVYVDSFTTSGAAEHDALRRFSLDGADCVVFVADGGEGGEDATDSMWRALNVAEWSGPVVLLVAGAHDWEPTAERLGFSGEAFAEHDSFEYTLLAHETASKLALQRARRAN